MYSHHRGKCFFFFCLFSVTFGMSNWSWGKSKPLIITSIRPLALIIDDLAGNLVETRILVQANTSPHDFALTISQGMGLSNADLIVWVGPQFESFLAEAPYMNKSLSMDQSPKLAKTPGSQHEYSDPHIWLGPDSVMLMASAIAKRLKELLPQSTKVLEQNLLQFQSSLNAQVQNIGRQLKPHRSTAFAVYHDGYGEFVKRFQLNQAVSLTSVPHEHLSAKRLDMIGERITGVSCLLVEKTESHQAQRYANLFEIPLVKADLLATNGNIQTFKDYLKSINQSFLECFGLAEKNRRIRK